MVDRRGFLSSFAGAAVMGTTLNFGGELFDLNRIAHVELHAVSALQILHLCGIEHRDLQDEQKQRDRNAGERREQAKPVLEKVRGGHDDARRTRNGAQKADNRASCLSASVQE